MKAVTVAGVDLGASSGRVIAARVSAAGVELHEVSRFPNEPVLAGGTLYWDILRLYADVLTGLKEASAAFPLASVGIDSWGVDYGLLDATGALISNPVHYRDARTHGVTIPVSPADLYAVTGIQHLAFNTIYQLAAAAGTPAMTSARTLLLIPDLFAYWLTGICRRRIDERLDNLLARRFKPKMGLWDHAAGRNLARLVSANTSAWRCHRARSPQISLAQCHSSQSGPTTPPQRWLLCRHQGRTSPTYPAERGHWSEWNWRPRC